MMTCQQQGASSDQGYDQYSFVPVSDWVLRLLDKTNREQEHTHLKGMVTQY